MPRFAKGSSSQKEFFEGTHRFEHWYRDNSVYFITARCHNRVHAFESEAAKQVFWRQFNKYSDEFGFIPWVTTLLSNHYHALGYLRRGNNLAPFMQRFHGSVAKLVNDLLPVRLRPFWRDAGNQNYFDGCLRERQGEPTYRYVLTQSRRHGVADDYRNYPHTHVSLEMRDAIAQATELNAFIRDVKYPRYER